MSDLKSGVGLAVAFFALFCGMFATWATHPAEQPVNGAEYLQSIQQYGGGNR